RINRTPVFAVGAVDTARTGDEGAVARGAGQPDFAGGARPAAAVDGVGCNENAAAIEVGSPGRFGHVDGVGRAVGDVGKADGLRLGADAVAAARYQARREQPL